MEQTHTEAYTTGLLHPDEKQQEARLRAQAFQANLGPVSDPAKPELSEDRVHVARSAKGVVAAATVMPFGQWFGGISVPMGGVAGVAVAPQARGAGLAKRLLSEAIEAMHDRGEYISALYPTTSRLYRSMGYEFAGRWERTDINIASLAGRPGGDAGSSLAIQALEQGQLEQIRPLYETVAAQSNGWLDRTDLFWSRLDHTINPQTANSFGYIVTGPGQDGDQTVRAGLTVTHRKGDRPGKYGVDVDGPFAASAQGMEAALGVLASLGTMADRATVSLPVEQLALYLPEAGLEHRDSYLWMLRIIDVSGALQSRGYSPGIETEVTFRVADEHAPWNRGRWRLTVSDGRAAVEQLGQASVVDMDCDITTLSGLYTGFLSPFDLARAGRLPGAKIEAVHALNAIFAAPVSRLVDFF